MGIKSTPKQESTADFIASNPGLPMLSDREKSAHANQVHGVPIVSRRIDTSASDHPEERPSRYRDDPSFDGRPHVAYIRDDDGLAHQSINKQLDDLHLNIKRNKCLLSEKQKQAFISYISAGIGFDDAANQIGTTRRVVRNTLRHDDEFRDRVVTTDGAIDDQCQAVVFRAVMDGDMRAALALMTVRQKFRSEKQSLAIARRKLHAEEKRLNIAADAISEEINFSALSDDELSRYSSLYSRLRAGSALTTDEKVDYADLCAKLSAPSPPKAIDVTSKVDEVFEAFDEGPLAT